MADRCSLTHWPRPGGGLPCTAQAHLPRHGDSGGLGPPTLISKGLLCRRKTSRHGQSDGRSSAGGSLFPGDSSLSGLTIKTNRDALGLVKDSASLRKREPWQARPTADHRGPRAPSLITYVAGFAVRTHPGEAEVLDFGEEFQEEAGRGRGRV